MKDFSALAKKYGSFAIPQYEIKVGNSKLSVKEFPVLSINVSQSIGSASSAQISFACNFELENSEFKPDIFSTLSTSDKVEIKLGYAGSSGVTSETVYSGIISTIHTDFSASGVIVNITCYDAMMLLFHNVHWRAFEKKAKVKDVVKEVLTPCEKYCKVQIDTNKYDQSIDENDAKKWVQDYLDDYKFIMKLATLTNSSFYSCCGTLYFTGNVADKTNVKVSLGWGKGLMSFSTEIDASSQIGSVTVAYRDGKNNTGTVTYDGKDVKGTGKIAAKDNAVVDNKEQETSDIMVMNKDQAETLAKAMYMGAAIKYVVAKGSTIGIPDIKVGDTIKITNVGKKLGGDYVLTQVNHTFDAGGFLTNFTCQRAKI